MSLLLDNIRRAGFWDEAQRGLSELQRFPWFEENALDYVLRKGLDELLDAYSKLIREAYDFKPGGAELHPGMETVGPKVLAAYKAFLHKYQLSKSAGRLNEAWGKELFAERKKYDTLRTSVDRVLKKRQQSTQAPPGSLLLPIPQEHEGWHEWAQRMRGRGSSSATIALLVLGGLLYWQWVRLP